MFFVVKCQRLTFETHRAFDQLEYDFVPELGPQDYKGALCHPSIIKDTSLIQSIKEAMEIKGIECTNRFSNATVLSYNLCLSDLRPWHLIVPPEEMKVLIDGIRNSQKGIQTKKGPRRVQIIGQFSSGPCIDKDARVVLPIDNWMQYPKYP